MQKKKKKWHAQPPLRFKAGAVCQSGCTHTSGDVAVNKKRRGALQAPDGDHRKASRPQI